MGTTKYPSENYYDSTLSKWGGYDNAYTEMETTVFNYDCPQRKVFKAMDVFSRFFVDPLLKKDCIDRELEAVESEVSVRRLGRSIRRPTLVRS